VGKVILYSILLCSLFLVGCGQLNPSTTQQLEKLFEDEWEWSMKEYPTFATSMGDGRYNDKLAKVSLADIERRNEATKKLLQRLDAIDRKAFSTEGKVNYDLFRWGIEEGLKWHELNSHLMPISHMWGFYSYFPRLYEDVPLRSVKDHENYIARMLAMGDSVDGNIELMREGIRRGYVLAKVVMDDIEKSIEAHIVETVEDSEFFTPFEKFPDDISQADRDRLMAAGSEAIMGTVVPAYKRFLKFMQDEYIPAGRSDIGISSLPNGEVYYQLCIKSNTSLEKSAEEIHRLGLSEVKRIKAEMEEVMEQVGFEGSFEEFREFLHKDERFYTDSAEELLKETAYILKKVDGELPKLFEKLPRIPVGIKEVPDFMAHDTSAAYYSRGNLDGTKAANYYVNTYDLKSRPLYSIESLALHEAMPGHHLQISLQMEIENVPKFRRVAHFTSYIEGWALYAEGLGKELGLYEDPYRYFGRLDYEMLRACRLVVDTGIHYYGWPREKAIDFMAENTSSTRERIATEIDRYIAMPGQALAYKIGELKFLELRERAKKELGDDFDIRKFHTVVLENGAIPFGMLESRVDEWIAGKK